MADIGKFKLIKNAENIASKKPVTADIFLTNYCNNKCVYCNYRRWGESAEGAYSMSFDEFVRYAIILLKMGVKGFILTGGGEPTVCRDFDKITAWLEAHNLAYGINTNFNELKLISPRYLKVSVDAHSREKYREIRGVDAFEKVKDNITRYASWKMNNGVNTSLGVQAVVTDIDEVKLFYDAMKGLSVDYIVMRPIESTNAEFYSHAESEKNRKAIISRLEAIAKKDPRLVINYKWYETESRFEKCYANWSQIALDERGNVIYCCHKPYEIVGHITDPDILDKKKGFATNIALCDVPCRLTGPNQIIELMSEGTAEVMFI